jgi:hypothetical protein
MNKNIFIIVLIICSGILSYLWYNDSSDYKNKIKTIKKERDSLEIIEARLVYENDSLLDLERVVYIKSNVVKKKLKIQQDETDAIPGVVSTYSNSKLDSILTNHRFRERAKNSNSIDD